MTHATTKTLTALVAITLLATIPAAAANITVEGGCTLEDAITAANRDLATGGCIAGDGADTITLAVNVSVNNFDSQGALGGVSTEMTIDGDGFAVTRTGVTDTRFLRVFGGGNLTVRNMTWSNGGGAAIAEGGAFKVDGGASLTVERCTFSGNSAEDGGAIFNQGDLVITESTFNGNSASSSGGAIEHEQGFLLVWNSTFSANTCASSSGSAIRAEATAYITLTTFYGNSSSGGGGGAVVGSTATVGNSVFKSNTPSACVSTVDAGGNKADQTSSCGTFTDPDKLTNFDDTLKSNGGPTLTHALLAGSNAINHAGDCGVTTDQRGASRSDGQCDSGAFEVLGSPNEIFADGFESGNTAFWSNSSKKKPVF